MSKKTNPAYVLRSMYAPERERVPQVNTEPSMTKTDHARGTDINDIIRKYNRTGVIDHLARAQGVYADVSSFGSYQDAVQRVEASRQLFDGLPAVIKDQFENDPAQFLDWAESATDADRKDLVLSALGPAAPVPPAEPSAASPEQPNPQT